MPGPGNWVSRDGAWFPAQTPRIMRIINPKTGLAEDAPVRDDKGNIILEPNPAAVASLAKMHDGHASAPVITFPETKPQQVVVVSAPAADSGELAALKQEMADMKTKLNDKPKRGRPFKKPQEGKNAPVQNS